jgi:hypothetical protein
MNSILSNSLRLVLWQHTVRPRALGENEYSFAVVEMHLHLLVNLVKGVIPVCHVFVEFLFTCSTTIKKLQKSPTTVVDLPVFILDLTVFAAFLCMCVN